MAAEILALQAQVQGLMNAQTTFHEQQQTLMQLFQQQAAQYATGLAEVAAASATGGGRARSGPTRNLAMLRDKPKPFSGKPPEWKDFEFSFSLWVQAAYPDAEAWLSWARDSAHEVNSDTLLSHFVEEADVLEITEFSKQLYRELGQLLAPDPLNCFRRGPTGNGLECWRLLQKDYNTRDPLWRLTLLRQILQPTPVKTLHQVRGALYEWERKITDYEREGTPLESDLKACCLMYWVPASLSEHLRSGYTHWPTFGQMKTEMVGWLQRHAGTPTGHGVADARSSLHMGL